MTDLSDVGLMIHFRRDSDDRARNLEIVLKFYRTTTSNLEIIICNDDKEMDEDLIRLCKTYDCTGIFFKNQNEYWRTLCFNEASKLFNSNYIIAGDTDVVINPEFLLKSKNILKEDKTIGIIYPYNGVFVNVIGDSLNKFINSVDIEVMESSLPELKLEYGYKNDNYEISSLESKGGNVMFSKQAYFECNGYNTNFIGWGFEDNEIWMRFIIFGYKVVNLPDHNAIAWHLNHVNAIRSENPHYANNQRHALFIMNINNKEEFEKYINSWKI